MVRNCPSEMTSQRRSFLVVRSMEMMQAWEYTREAMMMARAGDWNDRTSQNENYLHPLKYL